MRILCFVILLLFLGSNTSEAQRKLRKKKSNESRFRVSLLLGAYASQVDGDNYSGYDKLSLSGGLRTTVLLREHLDFNIELLYQEKGSRFETFARGDKDRVLNLSYVEVPFLFRYFPGKEKLGVSLEAGVAFARLIRSKIKEVDSAVSLSYESIAVDFDSNDLSLLLGLAYQWTPQISAGVRFSYSFNHFYYNPISVHSESYLPGRNVGESVTSLRSYLLGCYAAYTF